MKSWIVACRLMNLHGSKLDPFFSPLLGSLWSLYALLRCLFSIPLAIIFLMFFQPPFIRNSKVGFRMSIMQHGQSAWHRQVVFITRWSFETSFFWLQSWSLWSPFLKYFKSLCNWGQTSPTYEYNIKRSDPN